MYNEGNYNPTITDLLIATLGSARSTHKFYSIIRERGFQRYKKESVQVALYRLKKKGYTSHISGHWHLTKKGKHYARNNELLSYIQSPFNNNTESITIVSFDIPESDRTLRRWLRNQIKIFGYKMLQQSLWIGPGPLPVSFLKRLKDLGIREKVKIFSKVRKTG